MSLTLLLKSCELLVRCVQFGHITQHIEGYLVQITCHKIKVLGKCREPAAGGGLSRATHRRDDVNTCTQYTKAKCKSEQYTCQIPVTYEQLVSTMLARHLLIIPFPFISRFRRSTKMSRQGFLVRRPDERSSSN